MREAKEYEGFSRYEKRWFAIGAVMLLALLAVMWYFTMANRQIIPGRTASMEPAKLLAEPVFQHPGVTRLGPNHYRVAMIAQDFSFTPSKITVPAGAKISFVLTSRDVVHGFQVPGDMINVEVIPGRMARVSHTFEHPGTYVFDCNQYCGVGHPYMRGKVVVVPASQFKLAKPQQPSAAAPAVAAGGEGRKLFDMHCSACHQKSGEGIAGAFPPLAGHLPRLVGRAGGREYLLAAVLFGVQGKIEVKEQHYDGQMPAWGGALNNRQMAQLLNYALTAWGNGKLLPKGFAPYTATDVAAERARGLDPHDVYALREKLDLHH